MTEPHQIITVEGNEATFNYADGIEPGEDCELHLFPGTQVVLMHAGMRINTFHLTKDREQTLRLSKSEKTPAEQHTAEQQNDTLEFLKKTFGIEDPAEIPSWKSCETMLSVAFELLRLRGHSRNTEEQSALLRHLRWVRLQNAPIHYNGQTLLHYVCSQNVPLTLDLVQMLLETGCHVNEKNSYGYSALALVVHNRALFATPNGNVTPAIPDEVIDLLVTPESVRNTWHSLTGYPSNVDPKRTLHDTLGHVALAVTYIERLQELLTRCQAYRELRKG